MKKLTINTNLCIGCTLCTQIAPKTFKIGNDGKSHVANEKGDDEKKIKEAADSCPVNCISFK